MSDDGVRVDSRLCLAILGDLRTAVAPGTSVSSAAVGLASCDEVLTRLAALAAGCETSAAEAADAMADDATWVVLDALSADRW